MDKKLVIVTLLLGLMPAVSMAGDAAGFYLGAGIGSADIDDDGWSSGTLDAKDNSYRLFAGYRFNRVVGVELSYQDYGKISNGYYELAPSSVGVVANLGYSFDNGLRPFGNIGFAALSMDQNQPVLQDDSTTSVRVGFGVEYQPAGLKGLALRLGYEADAVVIEEAYSNREYDLVLDSFYLAAGYQF